MVATPGGILAVDNFLKLVGIDKKLYSLECGSRLDNRFHNFSV